MLKLRVSLKNLKSIFICFLGLFGHHGGWHHPDHFESDGHEHDADWGSKHEDSHGWDHSKFLACYNLMLCFLADAQEGGHNAGFRKGDEQDWARLDYGGHKSHASGDSYAHGYTNEHGKFLE